MSSHHPRLNKRVLTVFLLVGLPAFVAGVWFVLAGGRARMVESYGAHLSQTAQQAAAAVDSHVYSALDEVMALGRSPTLRQAVAAANRQPLDRGEVDRLDALWRTPAPLPAPANALLSSGASRYLADLAAHDSVAVELLATDRYGRLVAASGRVSDYFQADEYWWTAAFDTGTSGRVAIGDVTWDESARRYVLDIAVPIPGPDDEAIGGVLKVAADSREMLALVAGLRLGATGRAVLLRDDGTIVFDADAAAPGGQFFAAEGLRAHIGTVRSGDPRQTTFFSAAGVDGDPLIVGIGASQLVASFPSLPWVVAIVQAEAELLAPVQALGWYLFAVLALSALAMVSFALWFSFRIAQPPVTADLHLVRHQPVMHLGTTDDPILDDEETT